MKKVPFLLFIFCFLSCSVPEKKLSGPYLGQNLPQNNAELFAPGIVNDGISTRDITFTPNGKELYFCKNIANSSYSTLFFCKETKSGWTKPEVVDFATNPAYINIEPFISPDGKKLFFVSNKGNDFTPENRFMTDIWVSNREGENWGEPYKLDTLINTADAEFFPSVAKNGNLYFTRENAEKGEGFIYKSEWKNGKYQVPEKLPIQVNGGVARFNATIASDESFIIVPTYGKEDSFGATDYYISFFDDKKGWSNLLNLGEKINSKSGLEYSCSFSPDGEYFFFMTAHVNLIAENQLSFENFTKMHNSPENGNSNIYWIKASFIHELKEKATFTKNTNE